MKQTTLIGGITKSLVIAAALGASTAALAEMPDVLTIAAPAEGSSGYLIATAYSAAISANTEANKVILQPFAGSANWPTVMNRGEVHLGQHCGYEQLSEAYRGTGPFASVGPQQNIRTVMTGYGLPWGIHVVDPEVKSLEDLRGKAIFIQVSHTDHVTALRELFAHAGLEYGSDVEVLPFQSPQEAVQGLLTGRGDGVAFGLIPSLTEVKRSRGLHTLNLPQEAVAKVQQADPVWGKVSIKAGFGPLQPETGLDILEIECGLAAGVHLSEDAVHDIMTAMYENHAAWQDVSPLARQWTHDKALQIQVVPFHKGAVRYFQERGLWTDELERKNEELLAKGK